MNMNTPSKTVVKNVNVHVRLDGKEKDVLQKSNRPARMIVVNTAVVTKVSAVACRIGRVNYVKHHHAQLN